VVAKNAWLSLSSDAEVLALLTLTITALECRDYVVAVASRKIPAQARSDCRAGGPNRWLEDQSGSSKKGVSGQAENDREWRKPGTAIAGSDF
jgi:hypothetical protein